MKSYRQIAGILLVLMGVLLLASFALAGGPFEPPADFGCVPQLQATLVNDAGTPVPGVQKWSILNEKQQQNSAGEWRLKCKYGFSAIIGDPQPTPQPGD